MSLHNLNEWFLLQVKFITIRNIFPQSEILLQTLPNPKITIHAVKDDKREIVYTSSMENTCNPTWALGDNINQTITKDESWKICTNLMINVIDTTPPTDKSDSESKNLIIFVIQSS